MKNSPLVPLLLAMFAIGGLTAVADDSAPQVIPVTTGANDAKTLPVPMMPKTMAPMPGNAQLNVTKTYKQLSIEDQERLFSLYEENPAAYLDELRKVTAELRKRDQELNSKVMLAVAKYHKEENSAEKKKLMAEVVELTRQQFVNRSAEIENRLKEADKRLRELHKIHDFRKKNAEEIIARRIEDITREPGLKW